jgi:hypothetical protein
MSVLTLTLDNVKLLCGIGDTSLDTPISALIALQQPALEYALDPVILANTATDAGLMATLSLGVTEVLAGAFVEAQARNPEASAILEQQTFKISTLEISTKPLITSLDLTKIGAALSASGLARLAPFSRSARSLARAASGGDALMDDQAAVPLLIGSGMGQVGASPVTGAASGAPSDCTFDAVLGTDGHTDPPSGDIFPSGGVGFFLGGPD